jgi:hypothetical protein
MASILITCRQAHALLSGQRDATLGWRQRLRLRIHLLGCDACAIVGRNLALLGRAVRALDLHAGD